MRLVLASASPRRADLLRAAGFDFDIRPVHAADVNNERAFSYYFRDHKSVVHRIPEAFGGKGYYVQGDHLQTIPALYRRLVEGASR